MKKLIIIPILLTLLTWTTFAKSESAEMILAKQVDNCFSIINRDEFPTVNLVLIRYIEHKNNEATKEFFDVSDWECIGKEIPEDNISDQRNLIATTSELGAEKMYELENDKQLINNTSILNIKNINSKDLYTKKTIPGNSEIKQNYKIDGIDEEKRILIMHDTENPAFSDVNLYSTYSKALSYLKGAEIITGYPDGTFHPEKKINRIEFTVVVSRSIEKKYDLGKKCFLDENNEWIFTDLPGLGKDGNWYFLEVCEAKENNLISGYPDGTFRPNNNINFAEAAKIIATAFEKESDDTSGIWYGKYVKGLSDISAIPASIQSFDQFITRGEMAEIIYRIKAKQTNLPSTKYKQ